MLVCVHEQQQNIKKQDAAWWWWWWLVAIQSMNDVLVYVYTYVLNNKCLYVYRIALAAEMKERTMQWEISDNCEISKKVKWGGSDRSLSI